MGLTVGLLSTQILTPTFVIPGFANLAIAAEVNTDADTIGEEIASDYETDSDFLRNEEGQFADETDEFMGDAEQNIEAMPEYIDDLTDQGEVGIDAISDEVTPVAENALDEAMDVGWIPIPIVAALVVVAGITAYFVATKKPKNPQI